MSRVCCECLPEEADFQRAPKLLADVANDLSIFDGLRLTLEDLRGPLLCGSQSANSQITALANALQGSRDHGTSSSSGG